MTNAAIISKMKCGDVFQIKYMDGSSDIPDYITRTAWFDSDWFIIGGLGMITPAIVSVPCDTTDLTDISNEIDNLIKEKVGEYRVLKQKWKIDVTYTADEVFRDNTWENFSSKKC